MNHIRILSIVYWVILLSAPIACNDFGQVPQIFFKPLIQKEVFIEARATYYVNGTTGSDSNPGTQVLPWRTIQKAANTLVAGDKVIVKGGTYNERISQTTSGSPGNEIVFQVNPGDTVTCKGFTISGSYVTVDGFKVDADDNNDVTGRGFYVSGAYVTVKNCFATECPLGGIFFNQTSHHGYIYNNRCYHNGQNGIAVWGSYHLIENNEVWESVQHHPQAPNVGGADADGVRFHGDHHTFRGNWIHEPALMSDPYNTNPHIDAFQTFDGSAYGAPAATYCVFERNHVRHYQRTSTFMIDGNAHDITIKNNIFEVGWGVNCSNSHNIFIYNNTFIGDLSITSGYPGAFIADDGTVSNIEIKNNISVDYKGNGNHRNLTGCTGLVVDYNCLYNTDGSYPNAVFPGPQSHELWGKDPKFVNPSNRDFHLQSTSPCVNTGAVMPDNTWDYELNPRPVGSGWDIGGYEFNPGGPKEPENPVAQFFANPSQGFLPLQVNFDASASYDPDGSISKYEWDFGDDSTGSDKISNHTFVKRGNFNVALKVTDNTMRSDVAVKEIITYSKATALFTASLLTLKAPQVISFDGSASYDRYGTIVAYKWTFGDGASGNGKALIHRFPKKGSYIVTLKVINDQGYIGEISKSIEVSSSNLRERRR